MMFLVWILSIIFSYLLGSISFSYLITRWIRGTDIRDFGSGNAGATNTLRLLGKGPAILVFLLDALKGLLAVGIGYSLSGGDQILMMACGTAAVFGHNWPIFLRFKGGKGVATTIGVTLVLALSPALIAGIIAILFVLITRYVSLGSIIFTGVVLIVMLCMNFSDTLIWLYLLIVLMAIIRHKQNLMDLYRGVERKI